MKRVFSMMLTCALLLALVFTLASCSSYGKIEKNFTSAGYEIVNTTDAEGNDALSFIGDLEGEGKLSCTIHILKKSLVSYAVILEFGANVEAQAKLDELLTDADFAALIKVDDKAQLLRENCLLVPITLNIFDAENTIGEMITLFNK